MEKTKSPPPIQVSSDQRRRGEALAERMYIAGSNTPLAIKLLGVAGLLQRNDLKPADLNDIGVELAEALAAVMRLEDYKEQELLKKR